MEAAAPKTNNKYANLWLIIALGSAVICAAVPILGLLLPAVWAYAATLKKGWLLAAFTLLLSVVNYLIYGDAIGTLTVAALFAPAAAVLWGTHKFKSQNSNCVFYTSLAITIGLWAVVCLSSVLAGSAPTAELKAGMLQLKDTVTAIPGGVGVEKFDLVVSMVDELYLAVLYIFGAVIALFNGLMLHVMNLGKQADLTPLPPLFMWRNSRSYVYGMLALSVVGVGLMLGGSNSSELLWPLIMVMWSLPMALSGWSLILAFCRGKIGPFIGVSVALLFLMPYSIYGLAGLGALSALFIRKKVDP